MANIYSIPQNFSTTLNVGGGINNSQTTSIVLTSVTGLPTDGGILAFDWANPIDTTTIEYIEYTGISGNTLTGVIRGAEGVSAKAHVNGCTVVGVVSQAHIKRLKEKLDGTDITGTATKQITDTSTNEVVTFTKTTSAINQVDIKNGATGTGPTIAATGDDTNVDLLLVSKGSGVVKINGTAVTSGSTDGWTADSNTWTYSSVDGATGIVTINADLTGVIQAGDRIKFTQTTVKYFIVTKTPTFGAGNTTLTFWGGTDYTLANAAITLPSYSHTKDPFGFNSDPGKWKTRVTDVTDRSQASPVATTWYNLGTTVSQITLPIGIWNVMYNVNLQQDKAAVVQLSATLSTANNTESDSELTTSLNSAAAFAGGAVSKFKTLTLAAKTLYYLNTMTPTAAVTTIYNRNSSNGSAMVIEAVCAYL